MKEQIETLGDVRDMGQEKRGRQSVRVPLQ